MKTPFQQRFEKLCLRIVASSIIPCLVTFELAVFFRYFSRDPFSNECLRNLVVCVTFDSLIVWCHYEACKDPGYIQNLSPSDQPTLCKKCSIAKTNYTHHCSRCDKCVFLMDHHCLWTNNCLGYNTVKPFVLFNIYVSTLCIFGVATIVHE